MVHKQEKELNAFLKFAGYDQTIYEFMNSTGLALTYPTRTSTYYNYIGIQNIDPFYASYTASSSVDIQNNDSLDTGFTKDTIKRFKARVSSKINQRRKLERIRSIALAAIPIFIHESFDINQELITAEEIHFASYCKFTVGNADFSFYGTISGLDFNINTISHESYGKTYKKVVSIHHHFTDRQSGLLKPLL